MSFTGFYEKIKLSFSITLNLLPLLAVIIASAPFVIARFPDGHDSIVGSSGWRNTNLAFLMGNSRHIGPFCSLWRKVVA
jgi:hypothetical protein